MRNFFMGDVSQYCVKADEKLWACKRPLNLLRVNNGAIKLNFVGIGTSSWKSTLTELHLGYYIENEDFQYIADLHNLKVFSLGICIYVPDEFIAPLKNLYNLEELRINCGGEDCDLTNDGMIALFTLPCKHPEKSFPYKLKHLELADFHACRTNLLETINRNCPELRSLGLPYNKYMDDAAVPFIISHFKHLVHLNLSRLGDCYKNEDWNNLDDDDLPNLFFLKLHGNQVNIETFQSLNVKRPKLLISTKWNYLVNWTETDNGYIFHDTFDGDIRAIENDLRQIDGFCDIRITSPSFIYNRRHGSVARTSSFRSYPFAFKEKEPFEISIHDHSV